MNTIIKNNNQESNNSMKLSFSWLAIFKDNLEIAQFNEDGTENRFKLIQDNFSNLKEFFLFNSDLSKIFKVNLEKGNITLGKNISDDSEELKNNIRLVFFRRHLVEMSQNGKTQSHQIFYYLGYQYQDLNGQNRKIILKIDEYGNMYVGA